MWVKTKTSRGLAKKCGRGMKCRPSEESLAPQIKKSFFGADATEYVEKTSSQWSDIACSIDHLSMLGAKAVASAERLKICFSATAVIGLLSHQRPQRVGQQSLT